MRITLSPKRRDDTLSVSKNGDVLTINGEAFDFSTLPDGATIPARTIPCEWIVGPVERIDGEIHLTIVLPYGPIPEPWQAFPEPLISPPDGDLDLPADTRVETTTEHVEGGTNIVTTTYRWHQEPEVTTMFIPAPVDNGAANLDEAPSDVEA